MGVCETCVRVFMNERSCCEGCLHNFMNQGLIECEQLPLIAHISTSWYNSHISTFNIHCVHWKKGLNHVETWQPACVCFHCYTLLPKIKPIMQSSSLNCNCMQCTDETMKVLLPERLTLLAWLLFHFVYLQIILSSTVVANISIYIRHACGQHIAPVLGGKYHRLVSPEHRHVALRLQVWQYVL